MTDFYEVSVALPDAKAIAWDTCHKIYVLMDDEQVVLMREYGYGAEPDTDSLITADQATPQEMLEQIRKWYEESCGLRFVQAVSTTYPDPNDGFTDLIPQGADWVSDEEYEEEYA